MSATWGGFQSLIQLAIALNSAFAAFGSYTGNEVSKEKERLSRIRQAIKQGAVLPALYKDSMGGEIDIILLDGNCDRLLSEYNDFVTGFYRVICVISSCIGIGLLLYSSIYSAEEIHVAQIFIIMLFYIPFFVGVCRAAKFSADIYFKVSRRSKRFENIVKSQKLQGGQV